MESARKIILITPLRDKTALPAFVETCVSARVVLICCVGPDADAVEDEIDWLIVGDGHDRSRFIVTTSDPDEPLEEVFEFAENWICEPPSKVRIVTL